MIEFNDRMQSHLFSFLTPSLMQLDAIAIGIQCGENLFDEVPPKPRLSPGCLLLCTAKQHFGGNMIFVDIKSNTISIAIYLCDINNININSFAISISTVTQYQLSICFNRNKNQEQLLAHCNVKSWCLSWQAPGMFQSPPLPFAGSQACSPSTLPPMIAILFIRLCC